MNEVLDRIQAWRRSSTPSALATIVAVERKAPRGPGAMMAVSAKREIAGSISGGCVEPSVVETSTRVLDSGEPELVSFGISEDDAFAVGLACGGTIHVFVEPLSASSAEALAGAAEAKSAVLVATVLAGGETKASPGAKRIVYENGAQETTGSTGDVAVDAAIDAAASGVFKSGDPTREALAGADVFLQPFIPPPTLFVIGAVHPAAELCAAGKLVGYHVVVCDPRSPFATAERLPAADEIIQVWPQELLAERRPGARDAVCVLTHDLKFDVPALQSALDAPTGYIGAMGSKKTHAGRVARLKELGRSDADLARIHAPIGLPIQAESPAEIAVSVIAEIIAERRKGALGSSA